MEEILASIRRIISDDEARGAAKSASPLREPSRPISNVSHLFAEPFVPGLPANVVALPLEVSGEDEPAMITEAFAEAMETAGEPQPEYEMPLAASAPTAAPAPRPSAMPEPVAAERRSAQPLLSPRADAAVTSAFSQLADTIFSGKSRTIDNLVEDMLRPMLKTGSTTTCRRSSSAWFARKLTASPAAGASSTEAHACRPATSQRGPCRRYRVHPAAPRCGLASRRLFPSASKPCG